MIQARQAPFSVLVHYFSVDLEAERQTFEGTPYREALFSPEEGARIARLASDFDARFQRWLRREQEQNPALYCHYPQDVLFCRGFIGKGFHSYFGFTNFAEISTNIDRSLLYEFVREFVRELSRLFPERWWKFDYMLLFKDGDAFRRDTSTWTNTPADCPVSEEAQLFLSA